MPPRAVRALWLKPPYEAAIHEVCLPSQGDDDLVIRTCYTAVSRGTETLIYRNAVPVSEYERVRAPFQAGTLPNAVKHGYANVGVVEAGPDAWIGQKVFCLGPHQTRLVMSIKDIVALPNNVPPERAVLAANLETAINAVWDSGIGIGDHISVVGAGVIGALTAWLCAQLPGVDVELIDIDVRKAFLGPALGVRFTTPETASTERDRLFHTSASAAGLNSAMAIAGFEATITEMSWYGIQAVEAQLGGGFHSKRLTLKSSQVGSLPSEQRARWTLHRRLGLAVSLLHDQALDVLFEPDQPFDALPQVMHWLTEAENPALCQRIVYDAE